MALPWGVRTLNTEYCTQHLAVFDLRSEINVVSPGVPAAIPHDNRRLTFLDQSLRGRCLERRIENLGRKVEVGHARFLFATGRLAILRSGGDFLLAAGRLLALCFGGDFPRAAASAAQTVPSVGCGFSANRSAISLRPARTACLICRDVRSVIGLLLRLPSISPGLEQSSPSKPIRRSARARRPSPAGACQTAAANGITSRSAGNRKVARVPTLNWLSIANCPPIASVSFLAIDKPSPVPW